MYSGGNGSVNFRNFEAFVKDAGLGNFSSAEIRQAYNDHVAPIDDNQAKRVVEIPVNPNRVVRGSGLHGSSSAYSKTLAGGSGKSPLEIVAAAYNMISTAEAKKDPATAVDAWKSILKDIMPVG